MKDLILLDIDGTLFNPEHFGKLTREEFKKILETSEEELVQAIADYYSALESHSDFSPHEITSFISKKFNKDKDILDQVFWGEPEIYREALYPETLEVIKKLSQEKTLGIFSQGLEEMQRRKLTASGIIKYFDNSYIYIRPRKLSDEVIAVLPREATVVDDNHEVVTTLSSFFDEPIWLNRRSEENDPRFKTIHTLNELITNN